jgi:phosphoribosyl 1,2-cyclic phosphodiesterase
MEYGILGSGSTGNGIWVHGDEGLLVDCGFSVRTALTRLRQLEVDAQRIRGIVLTHEHSDHAGGAGRVARHLGVPVIGSPGTLEALRDRKGYERIPLRPGDDLGFHGFDLRLFPVRHDAAEPVGVQIAHGGKRIGVLTDTGAWDPSIQRMLTDLDAVYVESNHDQDMLTNGIYPEPLKHRIRGGHGHLSNDACAALLSTIVTKRTRRVVLGHLSLHNNTPQLALATNHAVLARHRVAPRDMVAAAPFEAVGPFSA